MSTEQTTDLCHKELSERAKHRLRITARFLRLDGHVFASKQFYDEVLETISHLSREKQEHLRELVDWTENYEQTERMIFGEQPRSRAPKNKPKFGKNRASHERVSDARREDGNHQRSQNGGDIGGNRDD